jgi:hypothetical protein
VAERRITYGVRMRSARQASHQTQEAVAHFHGSVPSAVFAPYNFLGFPFISVKKLAGYNGNSEQTGSALVQDCGIGGPPSPGKPFTRRRILKHAARIAATALMPPNVRRMLARQPQVPNDSFRAIGNIVVLMQESRSFDRYFGTLSGVRGFGDPRAMKLPNGESMFRQPDPANPAGHLLPFHLDTHAGSARKIPSTSYAWTDL